MAQINVFHPQYDRIVRRMHHERVSLMVREGLASPCPHGVRLTMEPISHPCRTHVSAGGVRAALGMSQVYTTRGDCGRVDGFKTIYAEDRAIFHAATLDCMVTQ